MFNKFNFDLIKAIASQMPREFFEVLCLQLPFHHQADHRATLSFRFSKNASFFVVSNYDRVGKKRG